MNRAFKTCYLRLITGEDVIASCFLNTVGKDHIYELRNPARIFVGKQQDGTVGVGLQPLATFIKDLKLQNFVYVNIKEQHVVFCVEPEDELRASYDKELGSSIFQPVKSSIKLITEAA